MTDLDRDHRIVVSYVNSSGEAVVSAASVKAVPDRPCRRCGCPKRPHMRWRPTTYCGRCGKSCPSYKAPLPRWLAWLVAHFEGTS